MKHPIKNCLFYLLLTVLCYAPISQATLYTFPINPPRELDFADREKIFSVRKEMLRKYPIFFSGTYEPTSSVFAQVESGKPWWGLKGLFCYGPGQLAIEGPSEETRFIDNPFILIGISEANAYVGLKEKGNCPVSYEKPKKLTFNDKTMTFSVEYNVSAHEKNIKRFGYTEIKHDFEGRNAIDFGVPYVHMSASKNIRLVNNENLKTDIYQFRNFLHVGGSCGYPGGCNNGSPYQAEVEFMIEKFPASATFKLWKKRPSSPKDKADLTYQIKIY